MKRIKEYILLAVCLDLLLLCFTLSGKKFEIHHENKNNLISVANLNLTQEKYEKGKIAITFDDGPHPVYTEKLLDGLRERGVVATFFVTGENAELHHDIIQQMKEDGHLIGNHTYSHIQLTKCNVDAFQEELIKTNNTLVEITGEGTEFVRPPYGSWDKKFEKELNMFPVLWTVDPVDWNKTDVGNIVNSVVTKTKENDIILMHDCYQSSVDAALQIVDILRKEGYQFVTVDEILFD